MGAAPLAPFAAPIGVNEIGAHVLGSFGSAFTPDE